MRERSGFTMVELLIVIVILGVLAAIAAPRFESSKRKTFVTSMVADLRSIVSTAESYYASAGTYANYQAPVGSNGATVIFTGTTNGWRATATHASAPGLVCVVERGPSAITTEPSCQ